jgi:hypothetical protein
MSKTFAAQFPLLLLLTLLLGFFGLVVWGWLLYPAALLLLASLLAALAFCLRAPLPSPLAKALGRRR